MEARRHLVATLQRPDSRVALKVAVFRSTVTLQTLQNGKPRMIGETRLGADQIDALIDALTAAKNALGR